MRAKLTLEQIERFWSKVDIRAEDECWEWQGGRTTCNLKYTPMTYGAFSAYIDGKQVTKKASRWAWIILYGNLSSRLVVCHTCDNPLCCNPYHLFAGTRAANQTDMQNKNRSGVAGRKHWKSKLTEAQVMAIRAAEGSQAALGRKYGVHPSHIGRIKSGERWQCLDRK